MCTIEGAVNREGPLAAHGWWKIMIPSKAIILGLRVALSLGELDW